MAIKHYKPTTNGRRGMSTLANEEITTSTPTKSLLASKSKTGGRNNQGKMTVVLDVLQEWNMIQIEMLTLL